MTADELTARGALERTPLETIAFAAWVNCPPDKIPPEYRQHTCEATMIAWRRVVAALTAALAASPEGQALIRETEARGMERAADKLHWLWNADGTKTERRVSEESAAAIRAAAAAHRKDEETPK